MHAVPGDLHAHASGFAALGDHIGEQAATQIEPLELGSAPPAVWFAARVAEAAGEHGISGHLRRFARNLSTVGDTMAVCANDYLDSDEAGAALFRGLAQ